PLGSGLTGWAVERGEPVLANDAHLDPRSAQIPGTPFEAESMVIVPLMAEGEVLGTLNIGRMGADEAHYSQNEFELTKLFAAQAAIALRNAEAHDEAKVQAERDALSGPRNHGPSQRAPARLRSVGASCHPGDATEKHALLETADQALSLAKGAPFRNSRDQFVAALDETAMALLGGSRTEELLDSILTRATRLLGVRTGYVYLIEPGDTHLTVRAAVGVMTEYVGYRLPVDEGIGGHVFRTGKPFVVDDYDAFEDAAEAFKGKVGAGVGVPLTIGGRVVGVLGLASGTTNR